MGIKDYNWGGGSDLISHTYWGVKMLSAGTERSLKYTMVQNSHFPPHGFICGSIFKDNQAYFEKMKS